MLFYLVSYYCIANINGRFLCLLPEVHIFQCFLRVRSRLLPQAALHGFQHARGHILQGMRIEFLQKLPVVIIKKICLCDTFVHEVIYQSGGSAVISSEELEYWTVKSLYRADRYDKSILDPVKYEGEPPLEAA